MTEHDFKSDLADYLNKTRVNASVHTLEEVINARIKYHALENADKYRCCFPTFIAADQTSPRNASTEYWRAKETQDRLHAEGPVAIFQRYELDLLVLPTEFMAARFGAVGRMPVGTVPLGYDDIGLPFGLAFVGKRYDEPSVFRAMSAYEAHFPGRKSPALLQ